MNARLWSEIRGVPNLLSTFRIVSPFLAIGLFHAGWHFVGLATGVAGGITDLFDGYLARKMGRTTKLGALLDQLGDLIFESTLLVYGIWIGAIPLIFIFVYLFREFVVLSCRTFLALEGRTIPSRLLGKAKTSFIQYAFFFVYLGAGLGARGLAPERVTEALLFFANHAIGLGLILGYISGAIYVGAFLGSYRNPGGDPTA